MDIAFESMKYGIVIWSIILAYAEISKSIRLIRYSKKNPLLKVNVGYVWIKMAIGFCGIYWTFYYTRSILNVGIPAHQVWVRGPLMLTIALFACGALMSLRRSE